MCGRYGDLDTHHIFNGAYRHKSDVYGATIKVCRICHNTIHAEAEIRKMLKMAWQIKIQKQYNLTDEQFIALFGKNYKEK